MATKPPARRLTFAQRENGAPVPQQMKRDELSRALRVRLYELLQLAVGFDTARTVGGVSIEGEWQNIFYALHRDYHERMTDQFSTDYKMLMSEVKLVIEQGQFHKVYGLLEFILRHEACPPGLPVRLDEILAETHAAYRIVAGDTFLPYTSDEEVAVVVEALGDLHEPQFEGAHTHYKSAVEALTAGNYADSMRESIHAVESVVKLLSGEATLQDGVKELAKKGHLHATIQGAIEKIAAWTNGVAGIRHAKKAGEAEPAVDEDDAVYMLGLCGSTVSYLKRVGTKAGLIK
jgi:HEPN domain-containing protein